MMLRVVENIIDVTYKELTHVGSINSEPRTIAATYQRKNIASGEDVTLWTDQCETTEIGYDN